MTIQVFVDESGNLGQGQDMVLAGVIAPAKSWTSFVEEWKRCLSESPTLQRMKMRDAKSRQGVFKGFSESQRDAKLKSLAGIADKFVRRGIYMAADVTAYEETMSKYGAPHDNAYFWLYQALIDGVCEDLWNIGVRERIEIVFDEHAIFGKEAREWYKVTRRIAEYLKFESVAIMPIEPNFNSDDDALPLQLADMFAWCIRRGQIDKENMQFEWLAREMRNIKNSPKSRYFDRQQLIDMESHYLKNRNESHRIDYESIRREFPHLFK